MKNAQIKRFPYTLWLPGPIFRILLSSNDQSGWNKSMVYKKHGCDPNHLPSKNQNMFDDVAHLLEAVSSLFLSLGCFHVWQQETSWAGRQHEKNLIWLNHIRRFSFHPAHIAMVWHYNRKLYETVKAVEMSCSNPVPKIPRTLTLKIDHAPFPFVESWTLQIKRQISQRHPTRYLVRWH